jgi:diacylglycerol kinase family enzyme
MAHRPDPPAPPDSAHPSSRAVAVVVNGNAKNVTEEVITDLDQILRGTDLFVSQSVEHAREIAQTLVERGYGTVLTGGGDGTFTVMVTEIVGAADRLKCPRPRFGYLKLGTGNALAHVVGASGQRTLAADIRRLKEEAGSRRIGLVEVEGLLAPFCGLGADAVVLQDYQQVKDRLERSPFKSFAAGPLSYAVSSLTRTLPKYFLQRMPHCRITNLGADVDRLGRHGRPIGKSVPIGEVVYEGPARLVGVSTIPYYGYGLRMFPFADERLDRMSLRVATLGPAEFVRNARAIWKGEYQNPTSLFDFLVQRVRIEVDPATALQIGGDVMGERSMIEVKVSDVPIRLVDFYAPPSGLHS